MNLIEKAIDKLNATKHASLAQTRVGLAKRNTASISKDEVLKSLEETSYVDQEVAASPTRVKLKIAQMKVSGLLTPDAIQTDTVEEYRHIKRPLLKNAFGQGAITSEQGNLIMITSARPSEGKTFTAMSLAVSIAMEFDRTVLLVDADLAQPSVHKFLDLHIPPPGLVDYLLDEQADLTAFLLKTDIPKLNILPAGRKHPHGTELLASQGMQDLTRELSQRYQDRIVIFDSPPLLATSQASVLATHVGQILVVVEANKTSQLVLKEALSLFDPDKVIGLILNKSRRFSAARGYGYYGYYSHGAQES